jgi:hypothetical protein
MMRSAFETGSNRTGIAASPLDGPAIALGAAEARPTSEGDDLGFARERERYSRNSEPLGSLPPPLTARGILQSAAAYVSGARANVLLDKLGERLAFERTTVRLYELLMAKLETFPSWAGGPDHDALLQHQRDALAHFALCRDALEALGADPTALTPSADLASMLTQGVPLALADPRVDLLQGLQAVWVAELVDHAGWEQLAQLARDAGRAELEAQCRIAHATEARHLAAVKDWIAEGLREASTR